MQRYLRVSFVSLMLIVLGCGPESETLNREGSTLNGVVTDKVMGGGVEGATIFVSSLTTTSDVNGAYRIEGLVDGLHELIIQADGYALSQQALEITAGQSLRRHTLLVPYD